MIKREVFLYKRKTEPAKKKNQKAIMTNLITFLTCFTVSSNLLSSSLSRSHYWIQMNNLGFLHWKNYLSWPYRLFVLHNSCSRNSFSKVVQIYFENNIRKQLASRPGDYSIDYDFCLLNLQWFSDFVFVILLLDWNDF